jgi:hypothetical protein
MTCEEAMERMADRLTGDLDAQGVAALREHLDSCPGCAAEAMALQALWDDLAAPGEDTPTEALRRRFASMLRREIAAAERGLGSRPPSIRWSADSRSLERAALGLAFAAALALSLGAGIYIGSTTAAKRSDENLAELRDEIRSLRSTVALALLTEPSASERLSGVAYGRELQTEDRRVADALFERLLEDPNVNVRLAALDALREAAGRPETRARLLESIPEQDSPLVQISAIDVLLESGSGSLAPLALDPDLDEVVRGYLRDRLERSSR